MIFAPSGGVLIYLEEPERREGFEGPYYEFSTKSPLLTNNLACQVHPRFLCVTNVELEERASTSTSWGSGRATGKAGPGGLLSGSTK